MKATKTFFHYFPVAKRDQNWGLYVTTVGASQFGPNVHYPPSGHPKEYTTVSTGRALPAYHIIYISSGSGWFKCDGFPEQPIEAGHVMFLFPGVRHSYAPNTATGWNEHWVGFGGDIARRLMRYGFFKRKQPLAYAGDEIRLLNLFNHLIETTRNNHPALQQLLAATTMDILAVLFSDQQSNHVENEPSIKAIQEAITKMWESSEPPLDLHELARKFNISYSLFRRAFTRYTGFSPYKYLLEIRLALARTLLSQSSLSVKEIASRTGFEDSQYFDRIFRKKVGTAPTTFRRMHQKK
jgi:AraC-like DNA-binding protein